jgi:DNA-binding Lrp family transcriptional regulator
MLDEKDKILYEHLLANARFPIKKLANAIDSSQATVVNRIRNLEERGYISGYDAIINWQKLPFIKKVYHVKSENKEQEIKFFMGKEPVFSVISLSGIYNLQLWCFFKTKKQNLEFEKLIKNNYVSVDIEKLEFPKVSFFNKQLRIPLPRTEDKDLRLDKIDIEIMKYLALGGARDSLLKIGNKLNIAYDTVNYRFKRLIKSGYFLRLVAQPGKSAFALQTIVLLIKLNENINLDDFYNKISNLNQIISIAKAKDSCLLVHFNSLNFEEYKNKLNEIFSKENRKNMEIILVSPWDEIYLNNRYPLDYLLD